MNNQYNQYNKQNLLEQQISLMTQGEIIVLLYEKCIANLEKAKYCIENEDRMKAGKYLEKSQRIVNYLNLILDMQYKISEDLRKFYNKVSEIIVSIKLSKLNNDKIDTAIEIMVEMKQAFEQANKKTAAKKNQTAKPKQQINNAVI